MTALPFRLKRMLARGGEQARLKAACRCAFLGIRVARAGVRLCRPRRGPIKGEVKAVSDGSYVRLMFRFDETVEATTAFPDRSSSSASTSLWLSPSKTSTSMRPTTSAPRARDPDGSAIRIALTRKVKLNTISAAERLYVDLLPENWKGPTPGVPQEVVDELCDAHERPSAICVSSASDKQKKPPLVRVKVATAPTFVRYIFRCLATVRCHSRTCRRQADAQFRSAGQLGSGRRQGIVAADAEIDRSPRSTSIPSLSSLLLMVRRRCGRSARIAASSSTSGSRTPSRNSRRRAAPQNGLRNPTALLKSRRPRPDHQKIRAETQTKPASPKAHAPVTPSAAAPPWPHLSATKRNRAVNACAGIGAKGNGTFTSAPASSKQAHASAESVMQAPADPAAAPATAEPEPAKQTAAPAVEVPPAPVTGSTGGFAGGSRRGRYPAQGQFEQRCCRSGISIWQQIADRIAFCHSDSCRCFPTCRHPMARLRHSRADRFDRATGRQRQWRTRDIVGAQ